jgi:hypothetical protein
MLNWIARMNTWMSKELSQAFIRQEWQSFSHRQGDQRA